MFNFKLISLALVFAALSSVTVAADESNHTDSAIDASVIEMLHQSGRISSSASNSEIEFALNQYLLQRQAEARAQEEKSEFDRAEFCWLNVDLC